eukprot:TRINITY_DN7694_c0_g1_i7.p2 TRINITY_DN7694_c0_g1~~TRINITY_DN7694_c0_g1_i7.p2  ORF type:complete len:158 (-),score=24.16 TRINITY_DN7694_c0_g1_i7:163-636(-)
MGVSDAFLANVGRIDSAKRRSPTLSLLRGIEDGNNSLSSRTLSLVPSSPTLSISGHADSFGPPSLSISSSPTLSALGSIHRSSSSSSTTSPSSLSSSSNNSSSPSLSSSRSSSSSGSSVGKGSASSPSSPSPRKASSMGTDTDAASPTATALSLIHI